jgi:hypothetical protein
MRRLSFKGPAAATLSVGVAPARGARNFALGRPWVAVRPHYEGLPFSGLDAARTKAGESLPDRVSQKPPGSAPGSYGPGDRNRRINKPRPRKLVWVERREAPAFLATGTRQDERPLRRSALHPLGVVRGEREDGLPGAAKNTGDGARPLFDN